MTPKRLFDNITRPQVHVKPVDANSSQWFAENMTIWGSFVDDCIRYDWRTAFANFWRNLTT